MRHQARPDPQAVQPGSRSPCPCLSASAPEAALRPASLHRVQPLSALAWAHRLFFETRAASFPAVRCATHRTGEGRIWGGGPCAPQGVTCAVLLQVFQECLGSIFKGPQCQIRGPGSSAQVFDSKSCVSPHPFHSSAEATPLGPAPSQRQGKEL